MSKYASSADYWKAQADANAKDDGPSAVAGQVDCRVRPGALWDNERCIELKRLEDLLNEVSAINNGSNCLGRIAKCIDLANLLNRVDLGSGRKSFKHFLQDRAIEDRFGPRA